MNKFDRSGVWPLKAQVFHDSGFALSNLKHCIVNDDKSTEEPQDRVDDRLTSSTKGSTSDHQDRTASKDKKKGKQMLFAPNCKLEHNCRDISSFKVK
jgi:hypothetical protein